MKLPICPSAPSPSQPIQDVPPDISEALPIPAQVSTLEETETQHMAKKKRGRKPAKPKNTRKAAAKGRTYAVQDQEWVPPPPPAPFTSYRLSSFDARCIIYPGANYDPWWDIPQLIQQVM